MLGNSSCTTGGFSRRLSSVYLLLLLLLLSLFALCLTLRKVKDWAQLYGTGYKKQGFPQFFEVNAGIVPLLDHEHFLLNPFHFIIHLTIRRSEVSSTESRSKKKEKGKALKHSSVSLEHPSSFSLIVSFSLRFYSVCFAPIFSRFPFFPYFWIFLFPVPLYFSFPVLASFSPRIFFKFLSHKSHWRDSNLCHLEAVPQDHPVRRGYDLM
jgi:hypothetical protein